MAEYIFPSSMEIQEILSSQHFGAKATLYEAPLLFSSGCQDWAVDILCLGSFRVTKKAPVVAIGVIRKSIDRGKLLLESFSLERRNLTIFDKSLPELLGDE